MVYLSQYRAMLLAILLTGLGLLAAIEPAKAAGHLVPTSPTADCPGSPVSVSNFTEWQSAITSFNGVTPSAPCVFNIAVTSNFSVTDGNTLINNPNAGVELRVDGADPALSKTSFAISGNGQWLPILIASNTTVTFEHLIIDDGGGQTAIPTNANGGCIFNFGVLTLINSQVTGCQLAFAGATPDDGNNGAGIYNNGTLTLIKSTVYNNRAGRGLEARGNGGGIYNTASGTLSIVNSTISGNYAGNNGGGIWSGGTATLLHTTVAVNERNGGSGSGVYVNGGTTTLTNSLIAGQTGTTGTEDCGVNSGATLTSGDYNLDSDNTCQLTATNDIAGSAAANLAGTLNVDGGWTPNFALLNGSAAIDKIPVSGNSCNGTGVVEDQREQVRPANNLCDIGAYESSESLAVTLGWFLAEANGAAVDFRWQTVTETGTAGFNVLAATEGGKIQLNDELIPSPVIDSLTPTNYAVSLATDATTFYLQEVGVDGSVTENGPFALGEEYGTNSAPAGVELTPQIWLPLMVR